MCGMLVKNKTTKFHFVAGAQNAHAVLLRRSSPYYFFFVVFFAFFAGAFFFMVTIHPLSTKL
jgi:hypothetical protein